MFADVRHGSSDAIKSCSIVHVSQVCNTLPLKIKKMSRLRDNIPISIHRLLHDYNDSDKDQYQYVEGIAGSA